jgi:hypothetical protein
MRWMAIVLVGVLGCGGAETKSGDGAVGVDPAKAKLLVNEAKNQIESGQYDKARALLTEANQYSDSQIRHRISLATEAVNEAESKQLSKEIIKRAEAGKCAEALALTAKVVDAKSETQVPALLRQYTAEAHLGCLSAAVEEGELARARKLAADPNAKKGLEPKKYKGFKDEVGEAVIEALLEKTSAAAKAGRWGEATAAVHAAVDNGEAGPKDRERVLKKIRKGITKEIKEIVAEAFGESGAKRELKKVDKLIKAGFWLPRPVEDAAATMDDEQARMQKLLSGGDKPEPAKDEGAEESDDDPTVMEPKELARLRRELAFWVACCSVPCAASGPKKMWLFGNATLHLPFDPLAKSTNQLKTGRAVWEIARGGAMVLIANVDPGKLADLAARAHKGLGWVSTAGLRAQDTSEMLPPGDSIVGARVWGPLREKEPTYEIGTVTALEGANVQVQRMSDRMVVSIARAKLHYGVAKKGIKVLAFCEPTKQSTAIIVKVKESTSMIGDPTVEVNCLDAAGKPSGKKHKAQMGGLRIRPEWLPKGR